MNFHEYQSRQLFAEYGIPVPQATSRRTPAEARRGRQRARRQALGRQGAGPCGRPRQGRRRQARASRSAEVEQHAKAMLGTRLVTHQSGPEGLPVDCVYVESGSSIDRELYLSLVVDRSAERIAIMASAAGGMDIEQVAHDTPEKIFTLDVCIRPRASQHLPVPQARLRLGPQRGEQVPAPRHAAQAREAVPRVRREPGRAQPADRDQGRPPRRARRQDQHRRQRAVPPEATRRDARQAPGRRARARRAASTTSTTSRSTATSAAWSTARASRWRRWT